MRTNKNLQSSVIALLNEASLNWHPPVIDNYATISTGDMPGDKVVITKSHISKANTIFPTLVRQLIQSFVDSHEAPAVVSVHGGSGVGKSEIGSILAYYLSEIGIGTYVLSGDNYPHRIPSANDAERLRIFRTHGLKALAASGKLTSEIKLIVRDLWKNENDADEKLISQYSWLRIYQAAGRKALNAYLSSPEEIDFEEINAIISAFKSNQDLIMLKRMGRIPEDLWYDAVDFTEIKVLLIEWTHGNNANLNKVDIPILLNSTPEETLAHRKSRNRDGKTDSAFITMVLQLEQSKLKEQASTAAIISTKDGKLIDYDTYLSLMNKGSISNGPMLNAYPDSIGGELSGMLHFLNHSSFENTFDAFYILPSIYNTDLDRGFSVIDYNLNPSYVAKDDLTNLENLGIDLKLDFILNHASVLSHQFQDLIHNGRGSKYADFFINWNDFWQGCGQIDENGCLIPNESYTKDMFFRKPGLPLLNVRMPDGEEVPYWNTFYQSVRYDSVDAQDVMKCLQTSYTAAQNIADLINKGLESDLSPKVLELGIYEGYRAQVVDLLESNRKYLGQMDLNIKSPLVWDFYDETLHKLASYGAKIVRLDAFAYAPKAPGRENFLNEPETWELLDKVKRLADKHELKLLPEIHSKYETNIHGQIAEQGYMTYDFFLPGLLIDALERKTWTVLSSWISEILDNDLNTVNMLGCHDGIPLLDLKGLLTDQQIQNLIDTVVARGGYVKDLHGKKNMYYQVNATYYSALGEDDQKMLLARAIQMFMPGKPQVWYLDLFGGTNDHKAVEAAGAGGHKEINRTNLTTELALDLMDKDLVQEQLSLLRLRNTHPAFNPEATVTLNKNNPSILELTWSHGPHQAKLEADIQRLSYTITTT